MGFDSSTGYQTNNEVYMELIFDKVEYNPDKRIFINRHDMSYIFKYWIALNDI
jgi:hypothetical protein